MNEDTFGDWLIATMQVIATNGHNRQLAAMKMEVKKSQRPPTMKQLERLEEYLYHPKVTPHLDELGRKMPGLLRTQGGAGVLINIMKGWINE